MFCEAKAKNVSKYIFKHYWPFRLAYKKLWSKMFLNVFTYLETFLALASQNLYFL
jgi:hypothetical protein